MSKHNEDLQHFFNGKKINFSISSALELFENDKLKEEMLKP